MICGTTGYETDMVNPNATAVDYIWNQLKEIYFMPEEEGLLKRVEKYRKMAAHRIVFEDSESQQTFKQKIESEKQALKKVLPGAFL